MSYHGPRAHVVQVFDTHTEHYSISLCLWSDHVGAADFAAAAATNQ